MSLPTLPVPVLKASTLVESASGVFAALYTAEQMTKYGQQCRAAALEDAATWLDFYDGQGLRRAEHIRSLK